MVRGGQNYGKQVISCHAEKERDARRHGSGVSVFPDPDEGRNLRPVQFYRTDQPERLCIYSRNRHADVHADRWKH